MPEGVEANYGETDIRIFTMPNFLVLSALFGLILFEWAWAKTYRVRNPNKELDEIFPAYRRSDGPKWKKWQFYPGAMIILVPKLILANFLLISLLLFINLTMIGAKRD